VLLQLTVRASVRTMDVPNLQDLSGSRMCKCRTSSGDARHLKFFCKIMRLLRLDMLKHNVCVQDARTAQAMLPRLQRFVDRATSPRLGRFLGPIQLLRVAKERRQSRWLSFYLSAAALYPKASRRSMHDARPPPRPSVAPVLPPPPTQLA
jgi:hypothetical protein